MSAHLQVGKRVEGSKVGDDNKKAGGRIHRQDGEAVTPPEPNNGLGKRGKVEEFLYTYWLREPVTGTEEEDKE